MPIKQWRSYPEMMHEPLVAASKVQQLLTLKELYWSFPLSTFCVMEKCICESEVLCTGIFILHRTVFVYILLYLLHMKEECEWPWEEADGLPIATDHNSAFFLEAALEHWNEVTMGNRGFFSIDQWALARWPRLAGPESPSDGNECANSLYLLFISASECFVFTCHSVMFCGLRPQIRSDRCL